MKKLCKSNKCESQTGSHLWCWPRAGESQKNQDPGQRPAPQWPLPGHGLNTERGFGALARSYKDYLCKDWNKTGQHAKLRSMQGSENASAEYLNQFVFTAESLSLHLGDRKRQKQI